MNRTGVRVYSAMYVHVRKSVDGQAYTWNAQKFSVKRGAMNPFRYGQGHPKGIRNVAFGLPFSS